MALIRADRVKESSTSTGTGAFTLAGADSTYRTFSSVCAVADTVFYAIAHRTANEWEVGLGTYSATNTLTRTTVHASSNANAAVTFSAGTKDVLLALTKTQLETYATLAGTETLTNKTINASSNTVTNVSLTTGVTGTLPLGNGGTGTTTAQLAMNALAGAVTSGSYLRGNGTNVVMATIQAADVPTLNQNTTGTASGSVSGTASYVPKFTGTNVVGNSLIYDSGTNVGIGTTSPLKKLTIAGNAFSPGIDIYKSPDGSLNAAQQCVYLGTGAGASNTGTTGGNEYGWLALYHSGTLRSQVLAGPGLNSFFLDNLSIGSATAGAQLHVVSTAAATKVLIVKSASAQTANLTEWQNSAGTAIASIDSAGNLISGTINSGNLTISHANNLKITLNRTGSFPYNLIQFTDLNGSCYVNGGGEGLLISGHAAGKRVIQIQGLASQTANLTEWQNSAGSVLSAVSSNGAIQPASLADSAAANNSIYYSTTASKLVYKDSAGTVNNLY